jgi:hypothetical protein
MTEEVILESGVQLVAESYNAPRQASESPNNVSFKGISAAGKTLFWLSRVGEDTLTKLCAGTPATGQYGDLTGIFSKERFALTRKSDNKEICVFAGQDHEALVFFLGSQIGYSKLAIGTLLGW